MTFPARTNYNTQKSGKGISRCRGINRRARLIGLATSIHFARGNT
jgi:hypothetical protein